MKENNSSKIWLALLAGAAVGVAIGYFLNSDKKDDIVNDLKDKASKLKDDIASAFENTKEDNLNNPA